MGYSFIHVLVFDIPITSMSYVDNTPRYGYSLHFKMCVGFFNTIIYVIVVNCNLLLSLNRNNYNVSDRLMS